MPENWISVDSGSVPPPPIYPPFGWSHFDIPKDITTVEEAVQYALKKRQLEPTYFDSQVRLWGYQCVDDDGKVKPKVKTKVSPLFTSHLTYIGTQYGNFPDSMFLWEDNRN